jgi:hypothetical protein
MKPILKNKNCSAGSGCGSTCISKSDTCRVTASPKTANVLNEITGVHKNRVLGQGSAFSPELQATVDKAYESVVASIKPEVVKASFDNIDKLEERRILGDIRHKGSNYDSVLDNLRKEVQPQDFNKAKTAIANRLEGHLVKRLVAEAKKNC